MIINDIWAIILPPVEEMIADFESGAGNLDIIAVIGSGAWNNYPIDETFMTIDNPNPNGINTSSTVMKFLRRGLNDGGEPHAGFVANETLNVSDYGFLHVMVWKPKISPLKITTHDDFQYTYDAFNKNPQQHTHTWVDVVFDLRGFENELWLFDFMPDYEEPLTSNELVEIYFDNLRLSNDSVPYTISINNFMANETSICENASVNFIPDTLSVNYDSVLWSFPGGIPASSSELFPTVEYAIAGNFDVTLTAWHNGLFNVIHKTGYIDVIPVPEIPAMPAGPEIICFSEFATEYYTNSEMAIWELLPDEAGNINYYDSACQIIWDQNFSGEVSLKVKIYNGCGEGEYSDPLYIQKLPSSNPDFSASQTLFVNQPYTVQFANLTPNQENFDFFWDFGNGDTSTETQPEYTYPENGEYPITLAATNKTTLCTDTLMKENYIFCSGTGIANNHFNGFKYYVDVTDRSLCLAFENPPDNFTFRLCSLNGTINRILVLTQKATIIPFNELTPGVYLFVINTNDKQITRKILIK
ncbi:MAG: hypothetical protein B6D61_12660 [Bacteroidetes bacterium 4484_249]|nr:MAG: hypothetical protein B6D61_12660 [Bacteroidetes bacterium 4484_249]